MMVQQIRRRLTWLVHNALMSPFLPIRLLLLVVIKAGEAADWMLSHAPGWRRYDGWSGW